MNRKKLMSFEDKTWDAHRLIWAIAELRNEDSNALYENSKDFIVKVHQQRIYSVLCTLYNLEYNKTMISSTIMDFVEGKFLSKIRVAEFNNLAEQLSDDECNRIGERDEMMAERYYGYLFNQLMNERLASERFECRNNGMLCGTKGHYLAIQLSEKIYACMEEANRKLEDTIILLLGDKGKFSFTESELIEKYHYPKTTDGELLDYEIDNF